MTILVHPVGRAEIAPLPMPDRFEHEIAYFMTVPGEPGVPSLGPGEYWIRLSDAQSWLDDGAFSLVSPLDSASKTEIELSEDQETWLEWMVAHAIEHVRLGR